MVFNENIQKKGGIQMKRILPLALAASIISIALLFTGCGGNKDTGTTQGSSQPAKEDIGSLLSKGKTIEGLSYDYVVTAKDTVLKGKTWWQGNKFKSETDVQGMKQVVIFDGETLYSYNAATNTAFKMTADDSNKVESPIDYNNDLETMKEKIKVLESTVYEGYKCKVIEVTGAAGKETLKMWIHEDYGIPIRVELTAPDGSKTVTEYKNLKVGPLSPETFTLPAGVNITDVNELLKQMPGAKQ